MTINTEPSALMDLFAHVVSGRANSDDISALINWLQEQWAKQTEDQLEQHPPLPTEIQRLQILLAWAEGDLPGKRASRALGIDGFGLPLLLDDAVKAGKELISQMSKVEA